MEGNASVTLLVLLRELNLLFPMNSLFVMHIPESRCTLFRWVQKIYSLARELQLDFMTLNFCYRLSSIPNQQGFLRITFRCCLLFITELLLKLCLSNPKIFNQYEYAKRYSNFR